MVTITERHYNRDTGLETYADGDKVILNFTDAENDSVVRLAPNEAQTFLDSLEESIGEAIINQTNHGFPEVVCLAHTKGISRTLLFPLSEHEDVSTHPKYLMEYAGRTCYQSYDRPNPKTADVDDYLRNIIDQGHESVLEHVSFTFEMIGVSRSFTHELVRHRHLSYSQVSQRYVDERESLFILPPLLKETYDEMPDWLERYFRSSRQMYEVLVDDLSANNKVGRKQAREAARCVLPNAIETQIIVTGNLRAWRDFLKKRYTKHADREMFEVAKEIYDYLNEVSGGVYVHGIPTPKED